MAYKGEDSSAYYYGQVRSSNSSENNLNPISTVICGNDIIRNDKVTDGNADNCHDDVAFIIALIRTNDNNEAKYTYTLLKNTTFDYSVFQDVSLNSD